MRKERGMLIALRFWRPVESLSRFRQFTYTYTYESGAAPTFLLESPLDVNR